MSILLQNITAVTMDDRRRVIENAFIAIEENRIASIGAERPSGPFSTVINGEKKVVMPGLVNAHAHTAMTLLRSYADDMNLQDWLFQKIFPFEEELTPERVYEGCVIGIQEMLETGTTCYSDMYFFQEEHARAAAELGIRAVLSEGITDAVLRQKLRRTERLMELAEGSGGMLKVGISPHAVYTCSPETLRTCAEYAQTHGLMIHTHLSETEKENLDCKAEFGKSPAELMLECGLFQQPATAAHGVFLSDADREILKENGVTVVHNPVSNLKLASGVAEIPKLAGKGINVALGTDGASSNNNLDLFEEIKIAAILHKGITRDPLVLPAWEILKMATVSGARALGYEDLGMIREGDLADLIVLDFDTPHLTPNHNTVSNLAYAVRGSDVEFTIVNGEIRYRRQR